jgi:hypothetical protein
MPDPLGGQPPHPEHGHRMVIFFGVPGRCGEAAEGGGHAGGGRGDRRRFREIDPRDREVLRMVEAAVRDFAAFQRPGDLRCRHRHIVTISYCPKSFNEGLRPGGVGWHLSAWRASEFVAPPPPALTRRGRPLWPGGHLCAPVGFCPATRLRRRPRRGRRSVRIPATKVGLELTWGSAPGLRPTPRLTPPHGAQSAPWGPRGRSQAGPPARGLCALG